MTETAGPRQGLERPKKTAILVAERIVEFITSGGYSVGDHLPPEREMIETYAVGRPTLREALRYLELQGIIRLKPGPGGGPVVTEPGGQYLGSTITLLLHVNHAPFRAVVEVREAIEPHSAALAALNATDEQRVQLQQSVEAIRDVHADPGAFLAENERWHELVATSSQNMLFAFLVSSLHGMTDGSALGVHYPLAERAQACDIHDQITTAILASDPDLAAELMRTHVANFRAFLEEEYRHLMDVPLPWRHVD
ncbi:MAG: FadR/GntR family transcriptional regulator [Acidimicrobiales bacterium]